MCSAEQPTSSETSGFLSLVASHSRAPASVFVSFTNSSSSRSGQLCEHRASSRHLKPTARKDPSSSLQDPMGDGKLKPRSNLKACLERNKCIYHTRSPPCDLEGCAVPMVVLPAIHTSLVGENRRAGIFPLCGIQDQNNINWSCPDDSKAATLAHSTWKQVGIKV